MIFQPDGDPPHWVLRVFALVDANFPDKCIGQDAPNLSPPR